mgnify:FL=1
MEPIVILGVVAALLLGGVVGWLVAHSKAAKAHGAILVQRDERIHELERQVIKLEGSVTAREEALKTTKDALMDSFKAAAATAMQDSNAQFLALAKTKLDGTVKEAEGDLDERKSAIEEMLKPLKLSIDQHKKRTEDLEKESKETFGNVATMLSGLKGSQEQLEKQTGALVSALKNPKVRGRWGEIGLKRIVEFSGMSAYCDFSEQASVTTDEGRLRPDMIVHLPNKRNIIVDSKLPLDSYMGALEAEGDLAKEELLVRHAKALRGHMDQLSGKAYWSQFQDQADFVILYVEVESAFGAALERDRSLIEDGIKNRILFATPTTLVAMLRSIAYTWQQHAVTENAQQIADAALEFHKRIVKYVEHLDKVGTSLNGAVKSYNSAVGSFESMVLPSGRRLEQLHTKLEQAALKDLDPIDSSLRELKAPGEE